MVLRINRLGGDLGHEGESRIVCECCGGDFYGAVICDLCGLVLCLECLFHHSCEEVIEQCN